MWLTKSSIQQSTQQVAGPPTCSLGLAALSASAACVYLLREINIYIDVISMCQKQTHQQLQ